MKRTPRLLTVLAALLLLPLYILPIWKIDIDAPQFPEDIAMYIYIDQLGGNEPSTLDNINILNHYIGMKEIHEDDIPELQYMPWILGVLIAFGLLAAVLNKRWMVITWAVLLVLVVSVAMYDFYLWGYDYGHNLDPMAPIKVPGMAYQPPLLGTKQMLNITATSLPHTGGWIAVASFGALFAALWTMRKRSSNS